VQISGFSSGVAGLQAAVAQVDGAAAATYDATVPSDQVTIGNDPLIEATTQRMTGQLAFAANLKTIQAAQQMDDVLLSLLTR
jgi:hypothetical protein